MAFWEELGKTITDKGKEATKKAKELTEVMQLKSQVSAEKTKIQEAYAAIGKLYYDEAKGTQGERYQETFSWVEESLNHLIDLEEQLSQLEGIRVCAECGCKVAKEDFYCRRCGAPMAQPKEDFETVVVSDDAEEETSEAALTETTASETAAPETAAPETAVSETPVVVDVPETTDSAASCDNLYSTEIEEDI